MAPVIWLGPMAMAWASITGMAWVTPGTFSTRCTVGSRASPSSTPPVTKTWPLKPRILLSSSARKPFITDMTMIRIATARVTPAKEITVIRPTPPSLRLARR
jgi:hypothetical protein